MISFVILHYQAVEETRQCIETIFKYIRGECRVVVVDNCSPNETGKELKEEYGMRKEVSVLLLDKNLGFAKGNNIGYKEAKKDNPDFIIVMNNDVFLQQKNLIELIEKAYQIYGFDVLGPDIYSTQKRIHQNPQRERNYSLQELKKQRRWLLIKNRLFFFLKIKYMFKRNISEKTVNSRYINTAMQDVVLHGACYIFSRTFIEKHNNCFYDNTFMYYESYILHFLGMREKIKFLYYPEIKVIHHEDVSTNLTYKSMYSKAKFVNQCLLESCREFIKIMCDERVRLDL